MEVLQAKTTSNKLSVREKLFQLLTVVLWCFSGLTIVLLMIYNGYINEKTNYLILNIWLILIPLLIIGIFSLCQWCRYEIKGRTILLIFFILFLVFFVFIWLIDFKSYDWEIYLSNWCSEYKTMTITKALRSITTVSDYTPFYNYFLIIFAHLFDI